MIFSILLFIIFFFIIYLVNRNLVILILILNFGLFIIAIEFYFRTFLFFTFIFRFYTQIIFNFWLLIFRWFFRAKCEYIYEPIWFVALGVFYFRIPWTFFRSFVHLAFIWFVARSISIDAFQPRCDTYIDLTWFFLYGFV